MADGYPWGRAVGAFAVISVTLAASVTVANHLSERPEPARPDRSVALDQQNIADYMDTYAPTLGPVPIGETLMLSGGAAHAARVQAFPGSGASYTVRIQNTGTQPLHGPFPTDAWVQTDTGEWFHPPEVRTLTTDPGATTDLVLTFPVPAQLRPAQLLLTLPLGLYHPTAQWTLTP